MGKRRQVPAALHSELSEYSSLIRALRTSNALDLTSHLTHHSASQGHEEEVEEHPSEGEDERPPTPTESASLAESSLPSDGKKLSRKEKAKAKARDTWTRWPLLAGDVHVPEWSLEDEVNLTALHSLKAATSVNAPASLAAENFAPRTTPAEQQDSTANALGSMAEPKVGSDDEDTDCLLPPHSLKALTLASAQRLSEILALLAAYVPPAEKSLQNRVRPINWETVLDVVSVNGAADLRTVDRVRQRMASIYPTAKTSVVHQPLSDNNLSQLCAQYDSDLFALDFVPDAPRKRKRGPYNKRKGVKEGDDDSRPPSKRARRSSEG